MSRRPVATITILSITGVAIVLQAANPRLLPLLERTPNMFQHHEWWRLITPLFMHARNWHEVVFNLFAVAILGVLVERIFGSPLWLVLYFASGIAGEIAGYGWNPIGAGSSVAAAGLLGAIAAWLVWKNRRPPGVFGGSVMFLGAIVLTAMRDLHGPPILVGFCIASFTLLVQRRRVTARLQANGY